MNRSQLGTKRNSLGVLKARFFHSPFRCTSEIDPPINIMSQLTSSLHGSTTMALLHSICNFCLWLGHRNNMCIYKYTHIKYNIYIYNVISALKQASIQFGNFGIVTPNPLDPIPSRSTVLSEAQQGHNIPSFTTTIWLWLTVRHGKSPCY